jgi:hypothetical protein
MRCVHLRGQFAGNDRVFPENVDQFAYGIRQRTPHGDAEALARTTAPPLLGPRLQERARIGHDVVVAIPFDEVIRYQRPQHSVNIPRVHVAELCELGEPPAAVRLREKDANDATGLGSEG